jgi:hypothetical protein
MVSFTKTLIRNLFLIFHLYTEANTIL